MEKRTCSCCGRELTYLDFYTNGPKNYSTVCKDCVKFQKNAKNYKDRMNPEDFEKWFNENKPKKEVKPIDPVEELKRSYVYRKLVELGNCYVNEITPKKLANLEKLLNCKIKYRKTSDNYGYILEVEKIDNQNGKL